MPNASPRVTLLDEPADLNAPQGSRPWAVAVSRELKSTLHDLDSNASHAQFFLGLAEDKGAWRALGYASFGMFLAGELDVTEDFAAAVKTAPKDKPIRELITDLKEGERLREVGRPPADKNVCNTNNTSGSTAEHHLKRLIRDADADPSKAALLAQIEAEEISVNQAAIAAGYRKRMLSVAIEDPEAVARSLKKHMGPEQLEALKRLL